VSDYYEVLGIKKTATEQEIKRAYRRLALKYHPDRNHAAGAAEMFNQITEAYDVLTDPAQRASYDSLYGNEFGQMFKAYEEAKKQEEDERARQEYYRKYRRWPGQKPAEPNTGQTNFAERREIRDIYTANDARIARKVIWFFAILVSVFIIDGFLPNIVQQGKVEFCRFVPIKDYYVAEFIIDGKEWRLKSDFVPDEVPTVFPIIIERSMIFRTLRDSYFSDNYRAFHFRTFYSMYREFSFLLLVLLTLSFIGLLPHKTNQTTVDLAIYTGFAGIFCIALYLGSI
jgi:hypothetical protein